MSSERHPPLGCLDVLVLIRDFVVSWCGGTVPCVESSRRRATGGQAGVFCFGKAIIADLCWKLLGCIKPLKSSLF